MSRMICLFVVVSSCVISVARAEKVDLSPQELREMATHVVTGHVNMIFQQTLALDDWQYTLYVAELRIAECTKGDGLAAGNLMYARYWQQQWIGNGDAPPSTSGHRGLPDEGDFVRVYLSRNAYDGFGDNSDGGFNVIGANGFESRQLTADNFRQLFTDVEVANRANPGQLSLENIESMLGPGESVKSDHEDLANLPGDLKTSNLTWTRWDYGNEVLLTGFDNGSVASIIRHVR